MIRPRISIITPNLNQGRFIERTICSVLDQGYEDLEYIVVDGGSSDDSIELMRNYEDQSVQPLVQLCRTRSDAINAGLSRATGAIVGILNSNDVYLPGTLDTVAKRMAQDDRPAWVVGQACGTDADDQPTGTVQAQQPRSLSTYLMRDSGYIPAGASFWRVDSVPQPMRFDSTLLLAADYEHDCRLLDAGVKPAILPETIVAQRDHTEPISAAATVLRGLEYIAVAQGYAARLALSKRYALWRNVDCRRRIYALAQCELHGNDARRYLWHEMLRHPWWMADDAVRQRLIHGVAHAPGSVAETSRSAA